MFITSVIGLALVFVAAGLAVFSGHIPVLRDWTGAAPLQAEDDTDKEVRP
jgi:hypothetical protein